MGMLRELRRQNIGSDVRLAVCVPCRDMVHSAFTFSLCKMIEHNNNVGIPTSVHFNMGTLLVDQRETLVDMARGTYSTHILWLDSDMMFPADVAQRLLSHGKPLVAGNYVTRQYPHKTVAYADLTDWKSYVMHGDGDRDLVSVAAVGMGCMLTNMSLFDQMSEPYFDVTWDPNSKNRLGEDFFLCGKVRDLGHDILIDPSVSLELKHLGVFAFDHAI